MIDIRIRRPFSSGFTLDVAFATGARTVILFGPSGAGKTQTLDAIAGFLKPDEGRIRIGDAMLFDSAARINLSPQQRQCGYVFQNYALFPHMTLRQNLAFVGNGDIDEMLARFRLSELADRRPHQLSGGQQQRGSIARALLRSPRVLLLDEPARGLDAMLRDELHETLREAQAQFGTPMILVTHDLAEARALGEEMVVLDHGQVVEQGAVPR